MGTYQKTIQVADTVIRVELEEGYGLGRDYRDFQSRPGDAEVDIRLRCSHGKTPFDSDTILFRSGETVQTSFFLREKTSIFRRKREVFIGRKQFTNCRIWCLSPDYLNPKVPYLKNCGWPLLALWGYFSVHGKGVLLHGALIELDGKHLLLLGDSGVGKTTLSRMAVAAGGTCLTDENPFLSGGPGKPRVYGGPWYSDRSLLPDKPVTTATGPRLLDAILLLHHAPQNTLDRLSIQTAVFAVLQNTRTFNWLPGTIYKAMGHVEDAVQATPVYSYGFLPDISAIHHLQRNIFNAHE
ncbi:hypothetical protein [Desulfosediminicola ganghwensis]|uniref:hypothetical protein n=1 Tax=Desulfosediminicola ganghwensis TaxID=2569540 RepID=UPI00142ED724|nr:hypothetical protein [Desulfosediminicola ganghwensis]